MLQEVYKKKRKSNQLCIHSGGRQFKLCKCETLFVFFVMLLLLEIHIVIFFIDIVFITQVWDQHKPCKKKIFCNAQRKKINKKEYESIFTSQDILFVVILYLIAILCTYCV